MRPNGYLDAVLKAAWPVVLPGQARPLAAHLARGARRRPPTGSSTPASRSCSCRRGAAGRTATCPLLDEARALLDAPPQAYGHVIVDEAQDLTPMQLRMVARRARDGALTMLGDVAQANRRGALHGLGRGAAASAARRRGRRRGAAPRLPRAPRDHGGRAAAARHDRARRRAADLLPHGRRAAALAAGRGGAAARPRRTRRRPPSRPPTGCSR